MSAKKNYKIDNATMTITADLTKLTPDEVEIVEKHVKLGYTFKSKVVTRDGSKRTRNHLLGNLKKVDIEIFKLLEDMTDEDGKKVKGAYSKAAGFASTIIKLGKYTDKNPDKIDVLQEYRKRVKEDYVDARLYAKEILEAA